MYDASAAVVVATRSSCARATAETTGVAPGICQSRARERAAYLEALGADADALCEAVSARDVVVLHDPQTAGLVPRLKESGATVLWRRRTTAANPPSRV